MGMGGRGTPTHDQQGEHLQGSVGENLPPPHLPDAVALQERQSEPGGKEVAAPVLATEPLAQTWLRDGRV